MKLSIRALATTVAILWGGAVLLVGLANLIWPSYGGAFLEVVASIYPGYHASGTIGSVIVGTLYAIIDGAVGGLIFAWLYNFVACCCKPPVATT
ncbi:MAG: hypothetical protein CMJ18_04465 [Phycisphaeraceae bacterium]|nr:hypothetical protein [Phycisphaeraceae bacterium]